MATRRFGSAEVTDILRRAAVVEGRADLPAPNDPTLADLMSAAEEAGLDPAEVRRAAALMPLHPGGATRVLLGAPDRRALHATLPGARLTEDRQAIVQAARQVTGHQGDVLESAPGVFVWEERHLGGATRVEARDGTGGLEIRVSSDRAGGYLGLWFVALAGWATLSALTPLGAIGVPAAVLGFVVAPVLLARPFWVRTDAAARRGLERLAMDVLRAAEAGRAAPG